MNLRKIFVFICVFNLSVQPLALAKKANEKEDEIDINRLVLP